MNLLISVVVGLHRAHVCPAIISVKHDLWGRSATHLSGTNQPTEN